MKLIKTDLIISKDYKKFIEENNIYVSDWDKATLIYNHKTASHAEKLAALDELRKSTSDAELQKQIHERIEQDKRYLELFKVADEKSYYVLSLWNEESYEEDGIYRDFSSAYESGKLKGVSFLIDRKNFFCKNGECETEGVAGGVSFDETGALGNVFWLYKMGDTNTIDTCCKMRFEERFVDLPMYFRQEDIVRIVGTDYYGIVSGPENDEQEEAYRAKWKNAGDYSDYQIEINLFYKGKEYLSVFEHEHVHPTEVEYAVFEEGDTRQGFLEYLKNTKYHGSLWFGSGRDTRRIEEVLSKLGTVWKQYPDMRLGQLLLNVCGAKNLFAIEDEMLLELLEDNILFKE